MIIRMQDDVHGSVNGGKTSQEFRAGQTYDVPDALADRFIADNAAVSVEAPEPEKPAAKKAAKKEKEE